MIPVIYPGVHSSLLLSARKPSCPPVPSNTNADTSSLLHAVTAAFHEVKEHHRKNKVLKAEEKSAQEPYSAQQQHVASSVPVDRV